MSRIFTALIVGALVAGAPLVAAAEEPVGPAALGPDIPEPPVIGSRNGRVEATITARPARIRVAGKSFVSNVYNGSYVPPVLRPRRGEKVIINFVNRIGDNTKLDTSDLEPQMSNLHYHGMAIPARLPADYIYMLVPPGTTSDKPAADPHAGHGSGHGHGSPAKGPVTIPGYMAGMKVTAGNTYQYEWTVPSDHAQGLFWYHPHPHGISEDQVLGGMSGLLVVDGLIEQQYPELRKAKRRTFLLKDIQLPGADDGSPKTKTINGVLGGTIRSTPGAFEVWELGNIGADSYFDFAIDNRRFWVIERDGNPVVKPQSVRHVYLPPSSRATIVVQVPPSGQYPVVTKAVATGSAGDPNPRVQLATLVSKGKPQNNARLVERMRKPPRAISRLGPTPQEVAKLAVTGERKVIYTENAAGTKFYLNGKSFDMTRIDTQVKLGDVEVWTLENRTDERHTFHIHQLDFLVLELSGTGTKETKAGLRDNIDIPPRDPVTKKPGIAKIKIPFTNPLIVGMFPYHCHILEHEDGGMMANLVVTR
jgi:FtsP/CotA-like multicopper oxidase with cupredoxin domain